MIYRDDVFNADTSRDLVMMSRDKHTISDEDTRGGHDGR